MGKARLCQDFVTRHVRARVEAYCAEAAHVHTRPLGKRICAPTGAYTLRPCGLKQHMYARATKAGEKPLSYPCNRSLCTLYNNMHSSRLIV